MTEEFKDLELLSDEAKVFLKAHIHQLVPNQFPMEKELIEQLHRKLAEKQYDAGTSFKIMEDPEDECFRFMATSPLEKEKDVFLIDHFLSFRFSNLRTILTTKKGLCSRLTKMLKFWSIKKTVRDVPTFSEFQEDNKIHLNFDGQVVTDPKNLGINLANAETLSLRNCKIENIDCIAEITKSMPKLKALWVDQNPCCDDETKSKLLRIYFENHNPSIEIFNSKFTMNTGEWGLKYSTFKGNLTIFEQIKLEDMKFVDISGREFQNIKDGSIFDKLDNCTKLIANDTFFTTFGQATTFLNMIKGMKKLTNLELDYYMLDLFWKIKDRIKTINPLIKFINSYDLGFAQPKEDDEEVERIISNIWKITNSYRLAKANNQVDEEPVFYIQDEVGSSIGHSNSPNVKVMTLVYFSDENKKDFTTYNIFWPIVDIKAEEFVTQDKSRNIQVEGIKLGRLSITQKFDIEPFNISRNKRTALDNERIKSGAKLIQSFENYEGKVDPIPLDTIKVFSTCPLDNLKHPKFKIVASPQEANVLWLDAKPASMDGLPSKIFVNKLVFDNCMVFPGELAETVQTQYGNPDWFNKSFNLTSQLMEFIGEYLENKTWNNDKNIWMTQTANKEDSSFKVISDNYDFLLRVAEGGQNVASKYIDNPIKFRGSKLDLTYYILIRSIEPLEVYVHDIFLVNATKNDFTLDKRRIFQNDTHFSVKEKSSGLEIKNTDFIEYFNKKNNVGYKQVRSKIYKVIKEFFILAKNKYPQMHNEYSRGFYAINFVLDSDCQPKLLGFSSSPNIKRASVLKQTFLDEVMGCLFRGEEVGVTRL